jgi:Paraquat-inducible protein A
MHHVYASRVVKWLVIPSVGHEPIKNDQAHGPRWHPDKIVRRIDMTSTSNRLLVLALVMASMALLIPGLFAPVLTIRGVLTREGVAYVAPTMLERGLGDETIAVLKSMMNPGIVAYLDATGADLRKLIVERLTPQIVASLQKSVGDVEVYDQTRSILGSVKQLYEVGSPVPATLILLFSVIVPLGKALLVTWAVFMIDAARRQRLLRLVESIAKWSMADVFVVALFIAYLAAHATQTSPGDLGAAPPLIAFSAHFGAGFYWFAAYCLFSLASQQYTVRLATSSSQVGRDLTTPAHNPTA